MSSSCSLETCYRFPTCLVFPDSRSQGATACVWPTSTSTATHPHPRGASQLEHGDLCQQWKQKVEGGFAVCHGSTSPTIKHSHPRAAVTSEPGRFGVSSIKQLHVVIATVRLLLDLKRLEDELHAVAFLGWDHPLTVGTPRVVVVPELCVWEQVLGFDFSLQVTSALWKEKGTFSQQIAGLISSRCCTWNKPKKTP